MFAFTGTLHKRVYNASPAQCWLFHHHYRRVYDVVSSCFLRVKPKRELFTSLLHQGWTGKSEPRPFLQQVHTGTQPNHLRNKTRLSYFSQSHTSELISRTFLRAELNPKQPFIVSYLRQFQQITNTKVGTFFSYTYLSSYFSEQHSEPAVVILMMGLI